MGGGASKVTTVEDTEEISRRVMQASDDRHHLTRMSLSIGALSKNTATIEKVNKGLLKNANLKIDQKDPYTKNVEVKKIAIKQKKKELEDLKNSEKLVKNLMDTLGPLKEEISTLIHGYTTTLGEMESRREGLIHRSRSSSGNQMLEEGDGSKGGGGEPSSGPLVNSFMPDEGNNESLQAQIQDNIAASKINENDIDVNEVSTFEITS
mmetsp:Transcript_11445/g.13808  ORF Transcript_11445/g.13808 Transcript_11445/m.13808 type:complete len:208 (-) Transcript_11445:411-1034(-)